MSTAVASAPPPAPPPSQPHHLHHHRRPSPPSASSIPPSTSAERHISPRHFPPLAPATAATVATTLLTAAAASEPALKRARGSNTPPHAVELQYSSGETRLPNGNKSPNSARTGHPPAIKVKKEPSSPSMPTSKRRPNRLDLSQSSSESRGPHTSRPSAGPLTSQQSAGLGIQDVGLACLSPGFQTNDPGMREQLQRSLDVRDQQRQIIEARQKGKVGGNGGSGSETGDTGPSRPNDTTLFGVQTKSPMTSRRKGPPPGLAINAPSASQFAHERVIQSAPLHQTFTGLSRPPHGPSALSQTSHIHHVPATQTTNRLPPIADVFANDRLEAPSRGGFHSPAHPPIPSPGFPPSQQQNAPLSGRTREFRSAEEAVQSLSGGRDDLMPKVVHHYGGTQPPTPPSPIPPGSAQYPPHHYHSQPQHPQSAPHHPLPPTHAFPPAAHTLPSSAGLGPQLQYSSSDPNRAPEHALHRTASLNGGTSASSAARRRGRDEYERDNGSPPSRFNSQQDTKRTALPFRPDSRDDWRRDMSSEEKREEFLRLCERAWDLFHS